MNAFNSVLSPSELKLTHPNIPNSPNASTIHSFVSSPANVKSSDNRTVCHLETSNFSIDVLSFRNPSLTIRLKERKMVWLNFGDYPAEYKPEVHGPYDPARYYGKGNYQFVFSISEIVERIWPRTSGPVT